MIKILTAIVLLAALLSVACDRKDENPVAPNQEVSGIIKENVVVLDESSGLILIHQTDSTLVYTVADSALAISKGDVVVSMVPEEYFRKVLSVTTSNDVLVLTTKKAVLTEAIERCSFDTTIELSSVDIGKLAGTPGSDFEVLYLAPGAELWDDYVNLTDFVLFSGNAQGVDLTVKITDGSVSYNIVDNIGFKIDLSGIHEFHTIISGDIAFDCELLVECNQTFNYGQEKLLKKFRKQVIIGMVGPLPVWVDIECSIFIGFRAHAYGRQSVTGGFDSEFDLEFGARFKDDAWTEIWNHDAEFSQYPIEWDNRIQVSAEAYIKPVVKLKIESLVGPEAHVRSYLKLDADFYDIRSWEWRLYGGLDGALDFDVSFFDFSLINFHEKLDDWEVLIASASGEDDDPVGNEPTADAGGPYYVTLGDEVQYYGKGTASDGYIVDYCWDLITKCLCEKNPTETPFELGTFTIRLKVQDNHGSWSEWDEVTVYVSEPVDSKPVADANGPYSAKVDESIRLSSSGSYDPDGDAITQWKWDFDDNATSTQANPTHAWNTAGTYYPTLTVYANGKWSQSDGCVVTIDNNPTPNTSPIADAGGPYYGTVGQAIQFHGSGSDPDAGDYITKYCWELLNSSPCEQNPYDTPSEVGTFTVRLRVQDNHSAWSDWDEATVIVGQNDQPPVADANGPYSAKVDESIRLSSSGSYDPDGDAITRWEWNFDDNATSTQANPTHAWNTAGTYYPTLTVYANGKWSGQDATVVTIENNDDPSGCLTYDLFMKKDGEVTTTLYIGDSFQFGANIRNGCGSNFSVPYYYTLVDGEYKYRVEGSGTANVTANGTTQVGINTFVGSHWLPGNAYFEFTFATDPVVVKSYVYEIISGNSQGANVTIMDAYLDMPNGYYVPGDKFLLGFSVQNTGSSGYWNYIAKLVMPSGFSWEVSTFAAGKYLDDGGTYSKQPTGWGSSSAMKGEWQYILMIYSDWNNNTQSGSLTDTETLYFEVR